MISVSRHQITAMKMLTQPIKEIINSGDLVINGDGFIYEFDWIKLKWIKTRKAEMNDYTEIPQLI